MYRRQSSLIIATLALLAIGLLMTSSPADAAKPHKRAKPDKRPTVAIMYFDYDGDSAELGTLRKGIAQMLISDLSHLDNVRLIERARLQAIVDELKLGRSKTFDKRTASKIGKLLGAKYMVLGGYFSVMGSLRVDARVVEVQTGRIVRSVGAHAKADDFMSLLSSLGDQLGALLASDVIEGFTKTASHTKPAKRKYKRPAKLKTATAIRYAQALDARDHGDVDAERKALAAVVSDAPDFGLASSELEGLIQ